MTATWPETAGPRRTVDIDTDDVYIIARAVKFAIDDGLPLRVHENTYNRRELVEHFAACHSFDVHWTWAATRIADATFTPRTAQEAS